MANYNLILASASPRRKEILQAIGISFDIVIPDVEEKDYHSSSPDDLVSHNARIKADFVAASHPHTYVLAADTTVFFNNKVYNKPKDLAEAKTMLQELSGNTHRVLTGICITHQDKSLHIEHVEESAVTFKTLSDATINDYFTKVDPLDKAGAYGLQSHADLIVDSFTGSKTNIIGLPEEFVVSMLKELHIV